MEAVDILEHSSLQALSGRALSSGAQWEDMLGEGNRCKEDTWAEIWIMKRSQHGKGSWKCVSDRGDSMCEVSEVRSKNLLCFWNREESSVWEKESGIRGSRAGSWEPCWLAKKVNVFLSVIVWQIKDSHTFLDPLPMEGGILSPSLDSGRLSDSLSKTVMIQFPTSRLEEGAASTSCFDTLSGSPKSLCKKPFTLRLPCKSSDMETLHSTIPSEPSPPAQSTKTCKQNHPRPSRPGQPPTEYPVWP